MCGRFALSTEVSGLPAPLRVRLDAEHRRHYAPRGLIRPGEPLLALRRDEGKTEASLMLWGLIPSWSKDPSTGPRPFNARAETVAEKASFRGAWRHRRCLIPATAFFEKGQRIVPEDGGSFWIAGLWERWLGADGSEIDTCTVLTTEANALIRPLHDRMPVLIPAGLEEAWMAPCDGAGLRALEPLLLGWDPVGWQARSLTPASAPAETDPVVGSKPQD